MPWAIITAFCLIITTTMSGTDPRLVVVVSLDQYRGDYLDKFKRYGGERGFTRLIKEGAVFTNCMYDYGSTATGPGHATILTGCYPSRHGVTANTYCTHGTTECMYCASDTAEVISPTQLEVPTLGDVLRARNARSKVIGVSAKDRAGVLMAGHDPTAVIWIDKPTLSFTSSSYYPTPVWLDSIKAKYDIKKYAGMVWTGVITESLGPEEDDQAWEGTMSTGRRTFPYTMPPATDKGFFADVIRSPFSMASVFGAALNVAYQEQLGQDDAPDVLCIGISSTDYLGHTFGADSREVQEMYVEVDKWIGQLIDEFDATVGRDQYVLVVTSDHGVAPIPEMLNADRFPGRPFVDAGRCKLSKLQRGMDSVLSARFGMPSDSVWVTLIDEPSVFISHTALIERKIDRATAVDVAAKWLTSQQGIALVARRDRLLLGDCPDGVTEAECRMIRNGFHPTRSGDLQFFPKRNWILGADVTSHGSMHDYDRWVPLIVFGGGVKPLKSNAETSPADIAPTLARMLHVELPQSDGKPLPVTGR